MGYWLQSYKLVKAIDWTWALSLRVFVLDSSTIVRSATDTAATSPAAAAVALLAAQADAEENGGYE